MGEALLTGQAVANYNKSERVSALGLCQLLESSTMQIPSPASRACLPAPGRPHRTESSRYRHGCDPPRSSDAQRTHSYSEIYR